MATRDELVKQYGYPLAFRHPTWANAYFVQRSELNLEFWENGEQVRDDPGTLGRAFDITSRFFFYWYEDTKWVPLFGFY